MADTPTPPAWVVVTQEETSAPGPTGKYVPGVKVTFRLAESGTVGSVFLPQAQYNVANVTAAINAQAVRVGAIDALSNEG